MGIKGLNRYLQEQKLLQNVSLCKFKAVVIDGNNICHQLYEKLASKDSNRGDHWTRGGEYKKFSDDVEKFFTSLIENGISPIVVLEGLREQKGKRRSEDLYKILLDLQKEGKKPNKTIYPTLALPTFLIIAQEKRCQIHVSAGPGDPLTAAIANEQQCPVLAFDSDYYMFELTKGYIPFDDSFDPPKCKLYHVNGFQERFKLPDPMMRLLIPTIHGNNDKPYQDFSKTIDESKSCESLEEYFLKHGEIQADYDEAKKYYYDIKPPQVIFQDHAEENPSFPVNIRESSIGTHFSLIRMTTATCEHVMKYAVENISSESVWNCSQHIRQYMYGFLGIEEVREKTREKDDTKFKKINEIRSKNLKMPVDINEKLLPDRKIEIVRTVLKCDEMRDECWSELRSLDEKYRLPVATAFYWYHTSQFASENADLVKALLFCFLGLKIYDIPTPEQSWANVHAFSEWQCVYSDALALNYMVQSPFKATNPGMLFSGKKALYCARHNFDRWLRPGFQNLLKKMLEIVLSQKKDDTENPAPAPAATATPSPAN